jgi:hypothetical protein
MVLDASDFSIGKQPMNAKMKRRISQDPTTARPAGGPKKVRRSRADRATVNQLLSLLKSGGDTRIKKVKRIRQSVRTRSYENDLKLSIAADRLARELSA